MKHPPNIRWLLLVAGATVGLLAAWMFPGAWRGTVRPAVAPAVGNPSPGGPEVASQRNPVSGNRAELPPSVNVSPAKSAATGHRTSAGSLLPPSARGQVESAPTVAELHARAARVEQEANHELERLVPLLNLSEPQQDRIFQKLARNSASWHPALSVISESPAGNTKRPPSASGGTTANSGGGTPTAGAETTSGTAPVVAKNESASSTIVDEILNELTPEQQAQLLKDDLDNREWWAEAIVGIEEMMDAAESEVTPVPDKTIDGSAVIQD